MVQDPPEKDIKARMSLSSLSGRWSVGMRDKEANKFVLWKEYDCGELVISIKKTSIRIYGPRPRGLFIREQES